MTRIYFTGHTPIFWDSALCLGFKDTSRQNIHLKLILQKKFQFLTDISFIVYRKLRLIAKASVPLAYLGVSVCPSVLEIESHSVT